MTITRAFRRLARRFAGGAARLRFTEQMWEEMLRELGRRGLGRLESGAFLLAARDGYRGTIERVVFLDDLDPNCLKGAIEFDGVHYGKLWAICERESLVVVGDVHTHPSSWVGQSPTDKDNPMIAKVGHLALIVPDFAKRPVTPHEIGVHEYLGDGGWRESLGSDASKLVYVGAWA